MKTSIFIRFWFPVFLYSGIIFYVSSLPGSQTPTMWLHVDKLAHVILFTPFGIFAAYAVSKTAPGLSGKQVMILVGLMALVYGISDEFHQSFVPGREASFADVFADMVGGALGGLLLIYKTRKK